MTAIDLRHLGRSRPRGQGVDTEAYDTRYQNTILASSLRDEDRKLAAAVAHAHYNGAPQDDDDLAGLLSTRVTPRPRETMANTPVGREHLTGKRHPLTSTRARPSDFDDEEN